MFFSLIILQFLLIITSNNASIGKNLKNVDKLMFTKGFYNVPHYGNKRQQVDVY